MAEDDLAPDEPEEEFPEEHERTLAEHTQETLEAMEATVQGSSYPTNATELKAEYASRLNEMVNETEAPADVFDRLVPEEYETPEDAREAILGVLTGRAGVEHGDVAEYNPGRELDAMDLVDKE